jgi:hypothetical protein
MSYGAPKEPQGQPEEPQSHPKPTQEHPTDPQRPRSPRAILNRSCTSCVLVLGALVLRGSLFSGGRPTKGAPHETQRSLQGSPREPLGTPKRIHARPRGAPKEPQGHHRNPQSHPKPAMRAPNGPPRSPISTLKRSCTSCVLPVLGALVLRGVRLSRGRTTKSPPGVPKEHPRIHQ